MKNSEKKNLLPEVFQKEISSNKDLINFVNENLTEVEKIASNYAPLMIEVQEQMDLLKTLKLGNPEHVEVARKSKSILAKIKSKADKQKDEDKKSIRAKDRLIQSLRNTVWNSALITQDSFKEIIEYKERLEQERLSKLQQERVDMISPYLEDASERDLKQMDEDVWVAYFSKKKEEYNDRIYAEKEAKRLQEEIAKKEQLLIERQLEIAKYGNHAKSQPELDTTENEWLEMLNIAEKKYTEYILEQEKIKQELEAEKRAKKDLEEKRNILRSQRVEKLGDLYRFFNPSIDLSTADEKEFNEGLNIATAKSEEYNKKLREQEEEKRKLLELEAEKKAKEEQEAKAEKEKQELAKKSSVIQLEAWINSFSISEAPIDNPSTRAIKSKFESFKKWAIEQI